MAIIFSSYMKNPTPPLPGQGFKYSGQSVRSLPMRIITIGKRRSKGIELLVEEYKEKLKHYCSVDDVQIRSNPKKTSVVKAQIEGEDAIVMQHIRSDDWVVLLDEHGLDIGSEKMAELVGDAGQTGSSTLTFCIGGPYGHGQRLRERADVTIRLSSLVLNHQVALIVLLEQLYRGDLTAKLAGFGSVHELGGSGSYTKYFYLKPSKDKTGRGLFSKDKSTTTSTNTRW